ncbi:hypothetical protein ABPG72_020495, partial [Tetrahymena utriculariae]
SNLVLTLFTENEKVAQDSEINDNVEFNYIRVKAAQAIEQAIKYADINQYTLDAIRYLKTFLNTFFLDLKGSIEQKEREKELKKERKKERKKDKQIVKQYNPKENADYMHQ